MWEIFLKVFLSQKLSSLLYLAHEHMFAKQIERELRGGGKKVTTLYKAYY